MPLKIETQKLSHAASDSQLSRFPACDELRPSLEASGQQWMLELARWYEADWALALEGGPEPSADSVIPLIDPTRQEEIRTVLKSIDTRYATERRSSEIQPTIDTSHWPAADAAGDQKSEPAFDPTIQTDPSQLHSDKFESLELTLDSEMESTGLEATQDVRTGPEAGDFEAAGIEATLDSEQRPKVHKGAPNVRARGGPNPAPGYRIKGVLGRGGMGVVYLAQQEGIDRLVALKMVISGGHADQLMLDRFQAEARAIGRFQHENIVRIYDTGMQDGVPYFSLEFVEGKTLSQHLDGKPMEPLDAAKLTEPMARAMKYAHDAGVIHRDLKPGNILLTKDGVPKITDFGLAKEFESDEQLSVAGSIVGTPAFMAPEQATGATDIGPLADVYGLGAVLYCMLTGRPPFQGTKATDTLVQVISSEPIEPVKLQPGIPKDLETICMKCLQKDRSQRYQDAGEMADDLGRFIRGEPIGARPISRPERVWRWCKRNPTIAIASGVAAALALIVMVGGPTSTAIIWGQKQEVIAAKDLADQNAQVAKKNEAEAVEAKIVANKNAEAASLQEKNAIDALKSMTFKVQGKMAGQTNLLELRQELIETVRKGLMRMEANQNNAADQNMIRAGIHVRLGDINMEIGRADRAKEEYEKCLAIFETLDKTDGVPFALANWSKIYQMLGDANRASGNYQEANDRHLQSLEIRRQWAKESPAPKTTVALATSLGKLGSLSQVRGDLDAAQQYMEEAVSLRKQLHEKNPNDANAFAELLGAKMVLGKVKFQQGEPDAGISLVTEAVDAMREFAGGNPDSMSAQQNAAMFNAELGVMQLYVGDLADAETSLDKSVSVLEMLKEKDPNDLRIHKELEEALYALSVTREELGQEQEAAESIQRLLDLRRQSLTIDPSSISSKIRLLSVLARAGELNEGAKLAEELAQSLGKNDTARYDLACGYAQLARARGAINGGETTDVPSESELADASIAALSDAIGAGFFRLTDLNLDPDLDPVRELPAFQEVVLKRVE